VSDEQDISEALDEDVVSGADDYTGDVVGEDFPDYPPDRPYGFEDGNVTVGEATYVERDGRGDDAIDSERTGVGQLVEPDASDLDDEEQLVAEVEPGVGRSPEESAMHLEGEP